MRKLLNTLYVVNPGMYLRLENRNIVIYDGEEKISSIPLLNLESIVVFSPKGITMPLMRECAEQAVSLNVLSHTGEFLFRISGKQTGNILLRKKQYEIALDEILSMNYSKNFVVGKIINQNKVVQRVKRDNLFRIDKEAFENVSGKLTEACRKTLCAENKATLRSIEGNSAEDYYSVFDQFVLQQKEYFSFVTRNRRPPTDRLNALLSYSYVLLSMMCTSALEVVGLDPYCGFMHVDRPGRKSLALDLEEELRAPYADRFVMTLINKKIISGDGFEIHEDQSVSMKEDTKRTFLKAWESKKHEQITHPYLKEKIEWGLIPYVQALLLARTIRGDLDEYPPFLWR